MDTTTGRRIGAWASAALLLTVVSQIVYMATLGGPTPSNPAAGPSHADFLRYFDQRWIEIAAVWLTELAAFIAIFIAAAMALAARVQAPFAWAALALSAIANLAQISLGLGLFRPAAEAGAQFAPVMLAIIQGTFFFYFLAKVMIGVASAGFGWALFTSATGTARLIGGAALGVGVIAAAVNFLALPQAMAWVFPAGLTGTLAALTAALASFRLTRS